MRIGRAGRGIERRAVEVAAAFLMLVAATTASAQDKPLDQVNLTNGGLVRGTVMEQDPDKGVTVKMLDGTTKKIPAKQVKSVDYAPAAPPPAPAPPPAAPTVAPPLAPVVAPLPPPPPEVHRERRSTGMMVLGLVAMPLGAVGVAAGAALYIDGNADHASTTNRCQNYVDSQGRPGTNCGIPTTTISKNGGEAAAGVAAMAIGVAVAGTGLVFTIVGASKVSKPVRMEGKVAPGGGALMLRF